MPRYLLNYGDQEHEAEVRAAGGSGAYEVVIDGRRHLVDACLAEESVLSLLVDGVNYEVHFARDRDRYSLLINAEHYELRARNHRVRSTFAGGAGPSSGRQVVMAPMPGRVVSVLVVPGQQVEAGEPLLTLEAMKMENQLRSPIRGEVREVAVRQGQVVTTGEKLAVVC